MIATRTTSKHALDDMFLAAASDLIDRAMVSCTVSGSVAATERERKSDGSSRYAVVTRLRHRADADGIERGSCAFFVNDSSHPFAAGRVRVNPPLYVTRHDGSGAQERTMDDPAA